MKNHILIVHRGFTGQSNKLRKPPQAKHVGKSPQKRCYFEFHLNGQNPFEQMFFEGKCLGLSRRHREPELRHT